MVLYYNIMKSDKIIDKKEVKHISRLARLDLKDEEIDYFARQLDAIIHYIGQLKKVDTSKVEPTSHPLPISNVFREDIVRPSLKREAVMNGAPDKEEQLFKVPRIITEEF